MAQQQAPQRSEAEIQAILRAAEEARAQEDERRRNERAAMGMGSGQERRPSSVMGELRRGGRLSDLDGFLAGFGEGATYNFADEWGWNPNAERALREQEGLFRLGQLIGPFANPITWLGRAGLHMNGRDLERSLASGQMDHAMRSRRSLDNWALRLGGFHGGVAGAGGINPGDTSLADRAIGAVLQGAVGAGMSAYAPSAVDQAPRLWGQGARSNPQVLDIAGRRANDPVDLDALYGRMAAMSEQAHLQRQAPLANRQIGTAPGGEPVTVPSLYGGETRFGRAGANQDDASVSALDDPNSLVRATIGAAVNSPTGRQRVAEMEGRASVQDAQSRLRALSANVQTPPSGGDPSRAEQFARGVFETPQIRRDALRTAMGDVRFRNEPLDVRGGNPPAAVNRAYPGMTPEQKALSAMAIVNRGRDVADNISTPDEAKKYLDLLDDPVVHRLFTTISVQRGPGDPNVAKYVALVRHLRQAAAMPPEEATLSMATRMPNAQRPGHDPLPEASEAALDLRSTPMSRDLARAVLNDAEAGTRRDRYYVDPNGYDRNAPTFTTRREYGANTGLAANMPNALSDLGAVFASSGVDIGREALWQRIAPYLAPSSQDRRRPSAGR